MPPLVWHKLDVRDIGGRGLNSDIEGPDGSPILFIQNGFIGPDQRPHPRWESWLVSNGGVIGGSSIPNVGDGGVMYGDALTQLDSNGNTSVMRYFMHQCDPLKNYAIFRALSLSPTGPASTAYLDDQTIPAYGSVGLNTGHNHATMFNNPFFGAAGTPPAVILASNMTATNPSITNGIPMRDVVALNVVASQAQQPGGPTCDTAGLTCGEFILYQNATHWFLTKLVANNVTGAAIPNVIVSVDPIPDTAFITTEIDRVQAWGQIDTVVPFSSVLGVHATGIGGAYLAAQTAEYFQGRIVMGNMILAPKWTVAGDVDIRQYVQKRNRLAWTILNGEKPTRGPFTTNSEGLTQLQWPWSIELNNFVDVDGVGDIFQVCNLGDNQLFIIGSEGCAKLTGYLATSVSGVNSATFDVRPILRSPAGRGPGCAVTTAHGVFYTDGNTIYRYDGSNIDDILTGAARYAFGPYNILSGTNAGGAGVIDDQNIYFVVQGSAGSVTGMLVYNHYNNKWSFHTAGIPGYTTSKGNWAYRNGTNTNLNFDLNGGPSPSRGLEGQGPNRSFARGDDLGVTSGAQRSAIQVSGLEPYIVALRPFGSVGVPKRFRHLVINYGLASPNVVPITNGYTVQVRAIYGWDRGWPDAVQNAPLIATLPPTNVAYADVHGGAVPTKTVRIALDDTTLSNFFGNGIVTAGWPDTIALFFQVVSGAGGTQGFWFKINSIDISWLERPGLGHVVMGAE